MGSDKFTKPDATGTSKKSDLPAANTGPTPSKANRTKITIVTVDKGFDVDGNAYLNVQNFVQITRFGRKEPFNEAEVSLISAIFQVVFGAVKKHFTSINVGFSLPSSLTITPSVSRFETKVIADDGVLYNFIVAPSLYVSGKYEYINKNENYIYIYGNKYRLILDKGELSAVRFDVPQNTPDQEVKLHLGETFSQESSSRYRKAHDRPHPELPRWAEENRMMQTVRFRVDPDVFTSIDEAAKKSGQTRTDWLREAVMNHLKNTL